jgi:hypothetical protein
MRGRDCEASPLSNMPGSPASKPRGSAAQTLLVGPEKPSIALSGRMEHTGGHPSVKLLLPGYAELIREHSHQDDHQAGQNGHSHSLAHLSLLCPLVRCTEAKPVVPKRVNRPLKGPTISQFFPKTGTSKMGT